MNKAAAYASLSVAVVSAALMTSVPAARAGGNEIAAGVAGGLIGGVLLGGALASRPIYAAPPPPVYYEPAPVYVAQPVCRLVREQYWDGYAYRVRRIQVCD